MFDNETNKVYEKYKSVDRPFKVMYKGIIKWLVGSFCGDSMASVSDDKDVYDPVQLVRWDDLQTVVRCVAHDICDAEDCIHKGDHIHSEDCDCGCIVGSIESNKCS